MLRGILIECETMSLGEADNAIRLKGIDGSVSSGLLLAFGTVKRL